MNLAELPTEITQQILLSPLELAAIRCVCRRLSSVETPFSGRTTPTTAFIAGLRGDYTRTLYIPRDGTYENKISGEGASVLITTTCTAPPNGCVVDPPLSFFIYGDPAAATRLWRVFKYVWPKLRLFLCIGSKKLK